MIARFLKVEAPVINNDISDDDDFHNFDHYHETCESAPVIEESCSAAACSILKMINVMMTMTIVVLIMMRRS